MTRLSQGWGGGRAEVSTGFNTFRCGGINICRIAQEGFCKKSYRRTKITLECNNSDNKGRHGPVRRASSATADEHQGLPGQRCTCSDDLIGQNGSL